MKAVRAVTGCSGCRMCTGHAFTGAGRSAARGTMDLMTLGVTALARKKCKACKHPMSEHRAQVQQVQVVTPLTPLTQSSGPPPGWYADPELRADLRWWDGTRWTEHTQFNPPITTP